MKKITSLLLLAIAGINFSSAQTPVLFGTCSQGGTSNGGTIFQADLDGSNLHAVHSFVMAEGLWPWGKTVQAPNGKIYGVTFLGGCADSCTLFSAGKAANAGSRDGRSRYRQFVTMLLPKRAAVTTMTTSLTGRQRCRRESQYHHY